MRRWLLPVTAAIIVVALAADLRSHRQAEAKKKREASYLSALQSYSQNLKNGLTRKEVENYIWSRAFQPRTLPVVCRGSYSPSRTTIFSTS